MRRSIEAKRAAMLPNSWAGVLEMARLELPAVELVVGEADAPADSLLLLPPAEAFEGAVEDCSTQPIPPAT